MEENIKILVIDDDQLDRKTLDRALKKSEVNYELEECVDAKSALELLLSNEYECIFLDYLLPGVDGLELLKKIREQDKKTPVIIVTSQGDEEIAVKMMKAGATDYVAKTQITAPQVKKILQRVSYMRSIEKQKEATEQALKNSEARLMEAQKIAKIGSWEYYFQTDEVYWSKEMYRIFELDPKKFTPKSEHFISLFHPDDRQLIREGIDRAMAGEVFNLDIRILLPNNAVKYVNLNAYFHRDHNGYYEKFSGTVQDINLRKEVEQELIEAKKLAEESGKVKEQFLANMSHEIRTPMNAIIGFANLLIKEKDHFTNEQQKYIETIHHAGENLLVIINDILDFSKIESGKFTLENANFNIADVVGNVVNMFKPKATEKDIQLVCDINEDVPMHLIGDPVRLNQVLVNLVSNSLKFTEEGSISLKVQSKKQSKSRAILRLIVEDTGIGIPKNKLKSIFQSFTQATSETTRKYGGTGLGLTIVKKIVEIQKGAINVESELEKGTTITIDLPFRKNNETGEKLENQEELDIMKNYPENIKVLMAEDNEMNKELAKFIFEDIGWKLDIADNGQIALDKLQSGTYDVVLMDIQMPVMDGYEATKVIREKFESPLSDIPIIAITAHALSSEIKKCKNAGMNDYISKPFKVPELIGKICKHIDKGHDQEDAKKIKPKKLKTDSNPEKSTSNSATESKIEQPVINLSNLQMMAKTQPAMINNIINIFLNETPKRLEELQKYVEDGDWVNLKAIAHKMKSSYSIIGAMKVKNLLESIETDCTKGTVDPADVNIKISDILKLNKQAVEELQGELAE